ncbi:hypothetical protein [Haloplanus halobius]|uniref:hypothetical protein n=1 Tax=Haloplanus halobius TaxID=2934938 RepID=UPI0020103801|nr:hypothetical protein [Haloplanus sp. XH21]
MPHDQAGTSKRRTRREFVGLAIAGAGSALAGCSTVAQSEDPFDGVAVDGAALTVTLTDGVEADALELHSPDGSTFVRQRVRPGTEQSLPLVETGYSSSPEYYQPGEQTLVVKNDGQRVGERKLSLAPDVKIADLYLPDDSEFNPVATIENVGTGPTLLTYLGFSNVPNPTDPPEETTGVDSTPLVPLDTVDVQSGAMPFAFRKTSSEADSLSCPGRTPVEVTVQTIHGDTTAETFPVRFDGEVEKIFGLSYRCSEIVVESTEA